MNCSSCNKSIKIQHALDASPFSWPGRKTIWYVCPQCNQGNHIRFDAGMAQSIKLQGSPGYEYDVVVTVSDPTIKIRIDPGFLHIWYLGKHYEIKEFTLTTNKPMLSST